MDYELCRVRAGMSEAGYLCMQQPADGARSFNGEAIVLHHFAEAWLYGRPMAAGRKVGKSMPSAHLGTREHTVPRHNDVSAHEPFFALEHAMIMSSTSISAIF